VELYIEVSSVVTFSLLCHYSLAYFLSQGHTVGWQIAIHNFQDWCCHRPKTNVWLSGHNHPGISALPCICTDPSASVIFKCILEVVFCEDVQHNLWFCLNRLNHLNYAKTAAFQLYLPSVRETQKSGVGVGWQSCSFGQKFPDKK
jgi:hypothetical protein